MGKFGSKWVGRENWIDFARIFVHSLLKLQLFGV